MTAPELLLLVGDAAGIWLLWQLRHWRHHPPQPAARPRSVEPPSHVRILQQDDRG